MPIQVTVTADELAALLAIREQHAALQQERDELRSMVRLVTAERDLAEERLRSYRRELFGAKSEARDSDQLGLFNEAEALGANATPAQEDAPDTTVVAHTRKKRGHRKPLDPNLPRDIVRHELPEAERFCVIDGHALVEFGVEISEQLTVIPEQLRVIQHQRVKYACPCCELGIKVTPAPPRIIPRGLLSESALAWIATGKYQFGMPLYRQAGLLRRFGGDISSNTIAASMVRVGLAAQPVINLMRDALLDAELIYCDETTLQVLKEEGRRAQTKSYLWAQMTGSGMPIRCFTYTPGRGAWLGDKLFTGIRAGAVMMTDGYEPYNDIAERHQLVHLGCWVHVRRYFVKAEDSVPKAARTPDLLATRFIKLVGKLFAAEARSETWSASRRQRLRRRYSTHVLAAIHTLMVEQSPGVAPKSLLGKGLTYLRSQWPKLIRYVENGDWPISNNPCENAIRPFCVGRRGWLFSDTADGAHASANLYSLVETCKANGIDPYRYLTWLFQHLPLAKSVDDYDALLPWKMPADLR
ncbi:TPA: IS66 family transposase [Burkholderia contaminans]|uniref:IS66 family transposase n=1 Tax=Burkholderia TaxID=32008 RepID=UPI000759938F|nr:MULTISPECIES: IS66 family transposase [Burkholderia]KVS31932.1 transposase [Burkholderia vietnamiensis]MBR8016660.1 IS66 family transposase [Burkholderia vietnamiensis]MCA7881543.1 IS66 family transposase [Burkholderia contaminans]MDN8026915.1 IS66 family transposase [Burkholderia contaminans]PRE05665.1 IS66 family transposase [Burkholderia multivorans]